MKVREDLTGSKFGKLTVVGFSHTKRYSKCTKVFWKCKCECGNECVVESGKLKSGHTKSCGCAKKDVPHEDLVGKRFNRLTVIDEVGKNKYGDRLWKCICDCGNICVVAGNLLKRGDTKSCGCLQKEVQYKTHKKYNDYIVDGDIAIFKDSNGRKFIVDKDDVNKIKNYCWLVNKNGYVETKISDKNLRLHRLIMDTPDNMIVDHINRNPSDNRKCNLRNCNTTINARNISLGKNNTSGILGVSFHKATKKWRAFVTVDYKTIHLGLFDNKDDAIKARKKGELEYYGEYIE